MIVLLDMCKIAFRIDDPSLSCATYTLDGKPAIEVNIRNTDSELIKTIRNW